MLKKPSFLFFCCCFSPVKENIEIDQNALPDLTGRFSNITEIVLSKKRSATSILLSFSFLSFF